MKKKDFENKLLEELEKLPIPSVVCKNIGISRQTFYRWKNGDIKFKRKVGKAMELGTLSICDLSESKLIELIQDKNFSAIRFWLAHKHKDYQNDKQLEDAYKKIEELDEEARSVKDIRKTRKIAVLLTQLGILKDKPHSISDPEDLTDIKKVFRQLEELFEAIHGEDGQNNNE